MGKLIDITGQRFGRLVVLARGGRLYSSQSAWVVRCDCGTEKLAVGRMLRTGRVVSCGCKRREGSPKNGLSTAIRLSDGRTIMQAATALGMTRQGLKYRLKYWTQDKAITAPRRPLPSYPRWTAFYRCMRALDLARHNDG